MGLIPEQLYNNIKNLNKLRNDYAHKLDFDFLKSDIDYFDPNRNVKIKKFGMALSNGEKTVDPKNAILWIGVVTFGWLNNHCKDVRKFE